MVEKISSVGKTFEGDLGCPECLRSLSLTMPDFIHATFEITILD